MAEVLAALAVVASVAQLADYGVKLSIKLYNFSSAVSSANKSISGISSDVSLTSTVLKELCQIIENDKSRVVSDGALVATAQTVKDCLVVFAELEGALDKSMAALGGEGKRRIVGEKLKWPFKQQKMEVMRSNLDRLKASLTLMLQVLSYARDVSNRNNMDASLVYQEHIIERLAKSEKEMRQRYKALQRTIEYEKQPAHSDTIHTGFSIATVNTTARENLPHPTSRGVDQHEATRSTSTPNMQPLASTIQTTLLELSLCFRLLIDLLHHHTASTTTMTTQQDISTERMSRKYNKLIVRLSEIQQNHPSLYRESPELSQIVESLVSRVRTIPIPEWESLQRGEFQDTAVRRVTKPQQSGFMSFSGAKPNSKRRKTANTADTVSTGIVENDAGGREWKEGEFKHAQHTKTSSTSYVPSSLYDQVLESSSLLFHQPPTSSKMSLPSEYGDLQTRDDVGQQKSDVRCGLEQIPVARQEGEKDQEAERSLRKQLRARGDYIPLCDLNHQAELEKPNRMELIQETPQQPGKMNEEFINEPITPPHNTNLNTGGIGRVPAAAAKGYGQHSIAATASAKQQVRRKKSAFELNLEGAALLGRRAKESMSSSLRESTQAQLQTEIWQDSSHKQPVEQASVPITESVRSDCGTPGSPVTHTSMVTPSDQQPDHWARNVAHFSGLERSRRRPDMQAELAVRLAAKQEEAPQKREDEKSMVEEAWGTQDQTGKSVLNVRKQAEKKAAEEKATWEKEIMEEKKTAVLTYETTQKAATETLDAAAKEVADEKAEWEKRTEEEKTFALALADYEAAQKDATPKLQAKSSEELLESLRGIQFGCLERTQRDPGEIEVGREAELEVELRNEVELEFTFPIPIPAQKETPDLTLNNNWYNTGSNVNPASPDTFQFDSEYVNVPTSFTYADVYSPLKEEENKKSDVEDNWSQQDHPNKSVERKPEMMESPKSVDQMGSKSSESSPDSETDMRKKGVSRQKYRPSPGDAVLVSFMNKGKHTDGPHDMGIQPLASDGESEEDMEAMYGISAMRKDDQIGEGALEQELEEALTEDQKGKTVLEELLAKWTNLPSENVKADNDYASESEEE